MFERHSSLIKPSRSGPIIIQQKKVEISKSQGLDRNKKKTKNTRNKEDPENEEFIRIKLTSVGLGMKRLKIITID